jgi:hypothetical protein
MTPVDIFEAASSDPNLHWISTNGEGARRLSSHFVTRGVWFFACMREGRWEFVFSENVSLDRIRNSVRIDFTIEGGPQFSPHRFYN